MQCYLILYIYETFAYTPQDSEREDDPDIELEDASAAFIEDETIPGIGLCITAGGEDTNGWQIYRSYDDESYELVSIIGFDGVTGEEANSTGAIQSNLPAHTTTVYRGDESFLVDIGTVVDLDTAITDAQFFANQRLCKIDNEIMAYKTCEETVVAGVWKVTGLIRGLFGTAPVAHSSGATFATLNVDFAYIYRESDIGKTLYFKFLTFYGNQIQDISDVSGISYEVKGKYKKPLPVSLMRINGREGLLTYKTDDVDIDWYFCSKVSGFGRGGYGNTLWGAYSADPLLEQVTVELEEEDGTAIMDAVYQFDDLTDPPTIEILEADRGGKNPVRVKLTSGSYLLSDETREILIEKV